MFLHLGRNIVVCKSDIIAILDINSTLNSKVNKEFLEMCEEEGFVNEVISGKLRSFIIVGTVKNRNVS
ncbi:MAG: DUF370 domain-containing protein, partial [Clostridiales bacterium]|nr:DUF370 domain-containing protein [Clostridiales bacterium]